MARAAAVFRRDYLSTPGWTNPASATYSGSLAAYAWKPNVSGRPVLGIIPGGGWTSADATAASIRAVATRFADIGFCVFVFDTTQSPPDPQTPITDVLSFMTWVRANAGTYNGATNKIAILGCSSGGHLAMMAAIGGVAGGTRPDAVISWSGPSKLGTLTSPGSGYAETYMGSVYSGNEAAWNLKSPQLAVTSNCCPLRVVGTSADPNGIGQAQFDDMHTAALAVGVDSTLKVYTGTAHAAEFGGAGEYMNGADDVEASAAWLASRLPWTRINVSPSRIVVSRTAIAAARSAV